MSDRIYFLQTERIGFSKWTSEDLRLAVGLWGDLDVTKLFDARGQLSEEQVKEKLEREIESDQSSNLQYWPIFDLKTKEHLGCCGLWPYHPVKNILEIGFHICSKSWGQGYATEAARGIIKYAFEVLGVEGLFAGHNPKNIASKNLLEKLGFQYTHDEFYKPTGLNHPSYLMTKSN